MTAPKPNLPTNRNDVPWEAYDTDGIVRSQWKHLTKAASGPWSKVNWGLGSLMEGKR